MRELADIADAAELDPQARPPASPQLRLNGYYRGWLDGAQSAAEIVLLASVAYVFYLVVLDRPGQWLWPAATGRSPQHLLTGGLIALLLLGIFTVGHRAIYDDLGRTHRLDRLDDFELHELARNGRAQVRSTRLLHLALATPLAAPAIPDLVAAWTANTPQAFGAAGPQLLLRLTPVAALYLLHLAFDRGLDAVADHLEHRQDAAQDAALEDAQQRPGFTSAPLI
ncbi:hypothetical protein ACFORH_43130 [Amycolatopsis roodepoortensis]|uniref:Uncharacterized protein n=1 Tax=Amycolatopsis roodepoortensis TaxID=700274 RepID=A0ABR9LJK1_9PSEU|nr:hypothetical protein [Amycolatopsis roodepoortensis]MBE1580465.1 hypothetical protein [Amycolatopsis roodepoortensis]